MEINKKEATWEELLGSNHWEDLLEPLNLDLRKLILRCGDFCQASYDAFNSDKHSKYSGSSRYGKNSFFQKVELESGSDYFVDTFLYATSRVDVPEAFLLHSYSREAWDRESNWIGYIAITSDKVSKANGRREIYIPWRGTIGNFEWINVLDPELVSIDTLLNPNNNEDDDEDNMLKIMKGWLTIYTSDDSRSPFTKLSARTQLQDRIKELVSRYKDEKLSIKFTGHSLGACLSVVAAFDLVENGISDIPVSAFVFGCPEVGNKAFNDKLKTFPNLRVLHVRNVIDLIPHYPSKLLGYVHTGVELLIDTRKSPKLKDSKNPSDWHNLQAILHIVAGWNGEDGEFEMKVKRSVGLVNKSSEFLKDECLVPASWWVAKNKGMVLNKDGEWALAPPFEEDIPVPEF
ncbi:hypothetical protein GIB67_000138 [Kingdonia uniflora]|uniref:Phospholipase A1 n=1 Tax=Kingdonia uniflora TaxID=39325 RepID=A0A7J7PA75_9MAGN|nr:hypothetical protein GIB67_000138 [Kingdonia uniflora]